MKEITDLDVNVDSNNLIYGCKGNTTDAKCDEFDNAFNLLDKIRKGKIKLADVKVDQAKFKSNLGEIKKRKLKKKRSKEQKITLYNIEMLYKAIDKVITFFDAYSLMVSEANQATKGEGLKILTSKQILQRLPVTKSKRR